MKIMHLLVGAALAVMSLLLPLAGASAAAAPESPAWITRLDAAKGAGQLFVVGAYDDSAAWVSLHEKDADGTWRQLITTPGFIG
ncbi:MAG: hypothetical protein IK136_00575, partial [Oscillospiraceae bacterium]|nr:hypothetical protein [Oscillospiraceae bacterium]